MGRSIALFACMALFACGGGGDGDAGQMPALRSGQVDLAYGSAGFARLPATDGINDMVVAPDGSALLTGETILKLDSRGAIDPSYGSGGRVALRSTSPVLDEAGNLYVIAGLGIAKLDPAGRLAIEFGVNGRATIEGWREFLDVPERLVRDREGNLYLAAFRSGVSAPFSVEVVKMDRDGRRVAGFGAGGALNVRTERPTRVHAAAVDAEGNLLLGGMDYIPAAGAGNSRLMLMKVERDGRLANDFGAGGIWLHAACETFRGVLSLSVEASGHIVIGGECHPVTLKLPLATVRKLDGRGNALPFQDPRYELFGATVVGGPVIEAMNASALLVRPDGRIYAAGSRLSGMSCSEIAMAMLTTDGAFVADFGTGGKVAFNSTGEVAGIGTDAQGRLYVGARTFAGCPSSTIEFAVVRVGG